MENRNTITLTFEDGSEKEFIILFTHQAECDGKNYVFILDDNDEEAGRRASKIMMPREREVHEKRQKREKTRALYMLN